MPLSRRSVLKGALAGAAALSFPSHAAELQPVYDEIKRRHDEALQRIQKWIGVPTIAAENQASEEDVKQVDPKEWTSPPWEARLVDKPGFGKVIVGRGAVNQKGPEGAFLAALHALRGAGRKVPVNLVLVAEGEEEIGSPHFAQVVRSPEVMAALSRCSGIFMPSAGQNRDGTLEISLGAKGVIECEVIASGEKWGRGPTK